MNERESLKTYSNFIMAQPRLSAQEERTLFCEYRAGNTKSLERIVNSSLYMVAKEVWRDIRALLPVWDLIQAGTEGLLDATRAYDPESGVLFKAVAVLRIHAYLTNAIGNESNTLRVPMNLFPVFSFVNRRRIFNGDDCDQYVQDWQDIHESEIDAIQVREAMEFPFLKYSMQQIDLEWTNSFGMYDNQLVQASRSRELNKQLASLDKREREVVDLYFGLTTGNPLTLEEIGTHYNLTRERIRQILNSSILRFRHSSRSRKIRWMLDGDGSSTELSYTIPFQQFDEQYGSAQEEVLDRRQEMYQEIFWPIIGLMRTPTGLSTRVFLDQLNTRAKDFLAEEGTPQSYFAIFNDARLVFGEFPKASLSLALKFSEDLVPIKKGTYALRGWGYVPTWREQRRNTPRGEEVSSDILEGKKANSIGQGAFRNDA